MYRYIFVQLWTRLFIVVDAVDGAGFVDVVLNYLLLLVLLVVSGLLMLLFGDLGRS